MENAGFTIIDAKNTSSDYGYAIGKNEHKSYVTWMYDNRDNRTVSFSQGHYFTCDPDAPARTKAAGALPNLPFLFRKGFPGQGVKQLPQRRAEY